MKKLSVFLILISLTIFFIFSCQKDKTYNAGESNNLKTTIAGIVLDESNAPLNGATVSAYGQTATTNQYGTFVLKNLFVNKDRCVLQFSKTGFFNRAQGFIASSNTVNYVRIILVSNASSQNFSAAAGGIISLTDGSSVDFQPNSFVTSNGSAYMGTVNIAIKHLSPDDANFGFMIPGGDLLGKDLDNKDVALYTYGMLGVELTGSSGEALQLASGKTATLTMSIAASQSASAPATIPLWYFDETTSLWKEEGAANKVGNNYVGMVKHFSWWNCDIGANSPIIKGKVVDCNGVPVPNCVVTFDEWATTVTDQNGEFQGRVPAATSITVQVLASNNTGIILNSQLENVPSLTNNQTFMVPDLVIPCITRVKGDLKSCSGETIAGFVSISNTSHFSFQYTLNGSFNLPAPSNNQMTLYAANSVFYQSQNITTLTAPNDLNSGNILLCDSLNANLMNNNFILNGGPFSNQLFNFNLTNSTAFVNDSTHGISIAMNGTAAPDYNIMGFSMGITDSVTGVTTCGFNFLININNTSSTYQILTPNYIYCNVTEMGTIGNKIKGNYFGAVYMNLNPGWIWGNISGNFDVIRTQ